MPEAARKGDTHKGICGHGEDCCPHGVSGPIVQGSPDTFVNDRPVARIGDEVRHNCPHCGWGWVAEGSETVFTNERKKARRGDRVVYPGGDGTIVEGSDDVFVGG